jgi:two-component system sensor histidine kinase TctE
MASLERGRDQWPAARRWSLSRQLLLWLITPQLVLWLAGGAAAWHLASSYVNEAIDAGLLQASRSLARQLKPLGSGLLIDFPKAAAAILEADPSDRQFYMVSSPPGAFILGNRSLPPPPIDEKRAQLDTPYFYDSELADAEGGGAAIPLRAVALYLKLDEAHDAEPRLVLIQVARSNNTRQLLARRLLMDMLLPLSSLILLMTLIVWLGIRAGLMPLKRLTQQVEGRRPTDLQPLQVETAPREVGALVAALNALLRETQHHLEAQQRFIGDAAHQLRTPLAGLKSQCELALQEAPEGPARARLQRVLESVNRASHVVTQLLTLARADPDRVRQQMQAVALMPFVRDLVAQWVPRAIKARIDLGWDGPDNEVPALTVLAEPSLLGEAIANLIDNAIRYAGAGAEVTVGVRAEAAMAVIWVRDNGPGIAPAFRGRVFERFFRASDTGDGCGLGLAIVHDIVQRHGGHVELHHPAPRGLEVRLYLPLYRPQPRVEKAPDRAA